MHHGGLGYLSASGLILLPPDFLEHLSVTEHGMLFGCYYPRSASPDANPGSAVEHDFMLTPVPPRFWSRCARLVVRVKHQRGALQAVANVLAEEHVAILHSECSRSGHRYATWSFHVTFENPHNPGRFDPRRSLYSGIEKARRGLEKALRDQLRDTVLFADESDVDLRDPVQTWPHTSLAYFHNHASQGNPRNPESALEANTFRIKCRADGVLQPDDSERIYSIIDHLNDTSRDPVAPCVVYATLDTHFFAVRIALIPNDRVSAFFEINIVHQRALGPDSCLGLIADILRRLGDHYTVWRTYNYIERHTRSGSEGHIVLLVEDCSKQRFTDPADYVAKARDRLQEGEKLGIGGHSKLKYISFRAVTIENVRSRLDERNRVRGVPRYAVFISFHHEDRALAEEIRDALQQEELRAFLADADLHSGDQISPEIRDAILNSQEMCVLCTRKSMRSVWVATEWGAAWALGKPIVPIMKDVRQIEIPVRLSDLGSVTFGQLEKYVKEVKRRRAERGWGRGNTL
jgi:hypothetical protein